MTSNKKPVILIVEDDKQIAELYATRLRNQYELIVTHNGNNALAALNNKIDIVLLDRRIPGLSGEDIINEIRERELNCRIAIVSAVEPDTDIIDLGFDDYLTKPISENELHESIDRLLKQAQYEEKISAFFSLARKKAILESTAISSNDVDDEYDELLRELEELREELTQTVSDFDEDNFRIACRDIAIS